MSDLTPIAELKWFGFREFKKPMMSGNPHADSFWQRRIKDDNGTTMYFVDAYFYDFSRIRPNDPYSVAFEATLYKPGMDEWMTLEFHGCTMVEKALDFFHQAYADLGCIPDPYNQE